MESICNDGLGQWTFDSLTDARTLQLAITTTDFLCALVITSTCLKYMRPLTCSLQTEAKGIIDAVKEIDNLIATLQNVRDNVDTYYSQWFHTIEEMCSGVGIQPSLPRRCNRQINRSNVPADTPSEYYCRCISIPLLDHLLSELSSRFSTHQQTALMGLSIIPEITAKLSAEECSTKISQLADMYQQDLPSPECIESEVHCW